MLRFALGLGVVPVKTRHARTVLVRVAGGQGGVVTLGPGGNLKCVISEAQAASGPVTVLALSGQAGLAEVDGLNLICNKVAAKHAPRTILDLTELTFICSLAIGSIVMLNHGVKTHKGKLELAGADPTITEVLARTRMHQILKMHATLADALAL